MSSTDDLQPWPVLHEQAGPDLKLFKVRHDTVRSPRNGVEFPALVLETSDWVNVIALTADQELVLVRQYRFGTRQMSLEIPGGLIDPGEEPLAAARRELREETGYTSEDWLYLGWVEPNPAFHDNRCHHFLARQALPSHEPTPDLAEDIRVEVCPAKAVAEKVRSGELRHSLMIAALARVLDLRDDSVATS